MARVRLELLPQGVLEPNDEKDDPLSYYYHPLVGSLYRRRIEAGLALLNPPYQRILEIGYGSGVLLPSLCRLGREVYGVDLASDPRTVSGILDKRGFSVRLYNGDICSWKLEGVRFDLVVAFSVFEHIADPRPALQSVKALLQPHGQVLIGMPRVDPLMSRLFPLIGYRGIDNHHITGYRKLLACKETGLRLQRFRPFPALLPRGLGLYYNMLFDNAPGASTGE